MWNMCIFCRLYASDDEIDRSKLLMMMFDSIFLWWLRCSWLQERECVYVCDMRILENSSWHELLCFAVDIKIQNDLFHWQGSNTCWLCEPQVAGGTNWMCRINWFVNLKFRSTIRIKLICSTNWKLIIWRSDSCAIAIQHTITNPPTITR